MLLCGEEELRPSWAGLLWTQKATQTGSSRPSKRRRQPVQERGRETQAEALSSLHPSRHRHTLGVARPAQRGPRAYDGCRIRRGQRPRQDSRKHGQHLRGGMLLPQRPKGVMRAQWPGSRRTLVPFIGRPERLRAAPSPRHRRADGAA
eukprot:scaffold549_cov385-Prasinococcus_capsulatus_cf.AAC.14